MFLRFSFLLGACIVCSCQNFHRISQTVSKSLSQESSEAHLILKHANIEESLLELFSSLALNFTLPVSEECAQDLLPVILLMTVKNETSVPQDFILPIMQMLDSMGKIPPGLFKGALTFWGYYPECKNISYRFTSRNRLWETEYSRAWYNLGFKDGRNPDNCKAVSDSGVPTIFGGIDLCLPKGCNSNDVLTLVQSVKFPQTNSSPFCYVKSISEVPQQPDYRTWIVWVIIGIIVGVGILASIVDYFVLDKESMMRKDNSTKVLLSFSLYTNISEIFSAGKSKPGQIGVLHCIRFFSIAWVVLGHTFENAMGSINNIVDMLDIYNYLLTQLIANASFSVDSFFFISGLLISFLWFKEYAKNPKQTISPQSWIMFYVHRIIRLSPPYYLVVAFSIFVWPTLQHNMPAYLSPGPPDNSCQEYFWSNFLYLNNYVHWKSFCFGVSWYLATDMQMFFFTPILIIALAMNKFVGLAMAICVFAMSTAANMITVYKNHYPATVIYFGYFDPEMKHYDEYMPYIYAAPWIRCQVYIMGILVGYFMQKRSTLRINKIVNLILWAFISAMMLFVVLCLFRYMQGHELSLFGRAMYSAFSRPLWAAGLAWIVISCYYGYGVMSIINGLNQGPVIYSGFIDRFCTLYVPVLFFSIILAIIWSASFEIPFSKVEMILLRKKRGQDKEKGNAELKKSFEAWETTNSEFIGKNTSIKM